MGDNPDQIATQAKLADLERKVAGLQSLMGRSHRPFTGQALQSLYWEACRSYDKPESRTIFLWIQLIMNLDAFQLLAMGRGVCDPFPWKPFLALLDHALLEGYIVDDAVEHLLDVAQDLLNAQGLGLLSPADLMGSPLPIQQAIGTIGI